MNVPSSVHLGKSRSFRLSRLMALVYATTLLASCSGLPFGGASTAEPVVLVVTATPAAPSSSPTPLALPEASVVTERATVEPSNSPAAVEAGQGLLQQVRERGRLICGVNADLPGFGFYDNVRSRWSGFDVDFCRAMAAEIFGNGEAVEYVALNTAGSNERFQAVRSGTVDVLFRNTTWTFGRDVSSLAFGPTTFHDGQSFMVRVDADIDSSADLTGKRICVARGTTSEQNLNDELTARGIDFEAVLYDDENQAYPAYDRGECDAVTSDSSQLASKLQTLDAPDEHIILGERISREPLGPVSSRVMNNGAM